ncbi:MAG: D-ribose pyranase [Clostridia bacterium]
MKKLGIMNRDISEVVAEMGHNDMLIICGSAYPIPKDAKRIDLALEPGLPAFMDVLRVVLKELEVERFLVAKQTEEKSPKRFHEICDMLQGKERIMVDQDELKKTALQAKAYIRTGECTPFSNVILISGVIF